MARYKGPKRITIPGFTPDYQRLIQSDPGYLEIRNALNAQAVTSGAQRRDQIRRSLIGFGVNPGFQDQFGDIDPATRALIDKSTSSGVSQIARAQREHGQNLQGIRAQQAARGFTGKAYRAPELEERRGFTNAMFDSQQEMMEYLSGLLTAFAESESERGQQLAAGATEAMERQMQLPQNQATADVGANLAKRTRGFYRGGDGQIYNRQGKLVDVPKARARYQKMVKQALRRGVPPKKVKNSWYYARLRAVGGV